MDRALRRSRASGGTCYLDVAATVAAVSDHAYIWVEDAVSADPSFGYTATDWTSTATTFDADYARETVAFGPAFFAANEQYEQCNTSGTAAAAGLVRALRSI